MTQKKDKKEYRPSRIVLFAISLIFFLIFSSTLSPLRMSLAFGIIFALMTLDVMLQEELKK